MLAVDQIAVSSRGALRIRLFLQMLRGTVCENVKVKRRLIGETPKVLSEKAGILLHRDVGKR
jgi:hypothetical protein